MIIVAIKILKGCFIDIFNPFLNNIFQVLQNS